MGLQRNHIRRTLATVTIAFLDNTDVIIQTLTAIFLLYTRSVGVAYFVAGASTCSLTVKLIKRMIRQPRPPVSLTRRNVKVSFGMPSTHSAAIAFYAAYIHLASQYLPIHKTLPQQNAVMVSLLPWVVVTPWAMAIVMSRVWLGYHTWAQVAAGSAYGVILALLWFLLWTRIGLNEVGRYFEEVAWEWFDW